MLVHRCGHSLQGYLNAARRSPVDNGRPATPLCQRGRMTEPSAADLVLGPATRLLWRATDSVHLELGGREVVVDGLPTAVVRRVAAPIPPHEPAPELPPTAGPVL